MLMDLYYQESKLKKTHQHFHKFMIEIHKQLHALRKDSIYKDPIKIIAKKFSKKYELLCFDEFHIADVADAMILESLFKYLFKYGVKIIITSNRHPSNLYLGGIQREKYLEFVTFLTTKVKILELKSETDYRTDAIRSIEEKFIFPINKNNQVKIDKLIAKICQKNRLKEHKITVNKRNIIISESYKNFAILDFQIFCKENYGTIDYSLIADDFSNILLTNISKISEDETDILKRFIHLIDIFYEAKVNMVFYSNIELEKIYQGSRFNVEYARTISRINEFLSARYGNS
tara:strand:+ start:1 stop:867 length:867 start_codon:yes stop_codon:yes gene_type:complete